MFDEGLMKQVYYRIVRQTLAKKVNEIPKMKEVEAIKYIFSTIFIV